MHSMSYRPYGGTDCLHLDDNHAEPCWGEVTLVDVDYFEDAEGNPDECLYYACEGHAPMYPLSVFYPVGSYLREGSKKA